MHDEEPRPRHAAAGPAPGERGESLKERAAYLYGLVITGSVLASAPPTLGLLRVAVLLGGTLLVYWCAESYAHLIAARSVARRPLHPDERRHVLGIKRYDVAADEPVPGGKHQLRAELAYDGGGLGKGGTVTLFHDGSPVGSGRVDATQPLVFSADETTDIGYESGTSVSGAYTPASSRFAGRISWVQLDVGTDDHDHFISPEERLRVAMARQ